MLSRPRFPFILALLAALLLVLVMTTGCAVNSVLPGVDVAFHAGIDGGEASVGAGVDIDLPEAACALLDVIGLAGAVDPFCADYVESNAPLAGPEAPDQAALEVPPNTNSQAALHRAQTLRPTVLLPAVTNVPRLPAPLLITARPGSPR